MMKNKKTVGYGVLFFLVFVLIIIACINTPSETETTKTTTETTETTTRDTVVDEKTVSEARNEVRNTLERGCVDKPYDDFTITEVNVNTVDVEEQDNGTYSYTAYGMVWGNDRYGSYHGYKFSDEGEMRTDYDGKIKLFGYTKYD